MRRTSLIETRVPVDKVAAPILVTSWWWSKLAVNVVVRPAADVNLNNNACDCATTLYDLVNRPANASASKPSAETPATRPKALSTVCTRDSSGCGIFPQAGGTPAVEWGSHEAVIEASLQQ